MSSASVRFSIIEWAIAATVALFVARLIWAHQLFSVEERFLAALGLSGEKRFLVAVPLAIWWAYRIYTREHVRSQARDIRAIRPKVIVVIVTLLLFCGGILLYALRGK